MRLPGMEVFTMIKQTSNGRLRDICDYLLVNEGSGTNMEVYIQR